MRNYRDILNREIGQRDLLKKQITVAEEKITLLEARHGDLTEARDTVNNVMLATQISLKDFIEEVVTLCLQTVLGSSYGFRVNYEIKRNQSEADLLILKDGEEYDPEDDCGGGVIDLSALGLILALWALAKEKPEPVLVLDEPGRCVSTDLTEDFGQMLKEVSDLLELQIIMINHDAAIINQADRAFLVTQQNNISKVEQL